MHAYRDKKDVVLRYGTTIWKQRGQPESWAVSFFDIGSNIGKYILQCDEYRYEAGTSLAGRNAGFRSFFEFICV